MRGARKRHSNFLTTELIYCKGNGSLLGDQVHGRQRMPSRGPGMLKLRQRPISALLGMENEQEDALPC